MARLFVCDENGHVTADIEASGPILTEALDHEQATPVVLCAVLMALSALAEGGHWPTTVLEYMSSFMEVMKSQIASAHLT